MPRFNIIQIAHLPSAAFSFILPILHWMHLQNRIIMLFEGQKYEETSHNHQKQANAHERNLNKPEISLA